MSPINRIQGADAADLNPLAALPECPRMQAVRSAFLPRRCRCWSRADQSDGGSQCCHLRLCIVEPVECMAMEVLPDERAALYLAAAVAQGKEIEFLLSSRSIWRMQS